MKTGLFCLIIWTLSICASAADPVNTSLVTVTVLDRQFTDGPDGLALPIIAACSTATDKEWTTLYGDLPVKAGQKEEIAIDGGGLVFRASCLNGGFRSDEGNVIVLRDGDRVADFLAMHHVGAAFGNQRPIGDIVGKQIDSDGRVRIGDKGLLVLFELGTDDAKDPAYDFQDLVLLATFDDLKALGMVPRQTPTSTKEN